MASRRTSLSDYADLAIAREIDSKYDDVRIVADHIEEVTTIVSNLETIVSVNDIKEDLTSVLNIKDELLRLYSIAEELTVLSADIEVFTSLFADKFKLDSIFADKVKLDSLYTDKVTLDSLYADKIKLDELYNNLLVLNTVYADLVNINTVKDNLQNIDTVANDITNINNVAQELPKIDIVVDSVPKMDTIIADLVNVDSVANDITNINSVAIELPKVNLVVDNLVSITTVTDNITDINTVATSISDINTLAQETNNIHNIVTNIPNINLVLADINNIDTLVTNIPTIDTLVQDIPIITAVADNLPNVNTIVTNIMDITSVANDLTNINEVVPKLQHIDTVVNNLSNITTVVDNIVDVNIVANDISLIEDIATQVVPNIPELLLVDDKATQVATDTATVISMKLAVESLYNTFNDRFLGVSNTDLTVDHNGQPLLDGALYFNTVDNVLKVYDSGNAIWLSIPQLLLSSLLDVKLTSVTTGDVIVWDGTQWVNTNLQLAITNNTDVTANTLVRHTHVNKSILDVINQNLSNTGTPEFTSVKVSGGTNGQGTFTWDVDNVTALLNIGTYAYPLGQALPVHCTKHGSVANIAKGRPVIAMGTTGGSKKILIGEATLANWQLIDPTATEVPAKYVLGVTVENITNNGAIICFGKVGDITGVSYMQGTVYYVDEVNGGFTSVAPTTGLNMPIAFAINSNTLMVRVTPINELDITRGVTAYNRSVDMGTYSDFESAFNIAEAN